MLAVLLEPFIVEAAVSEAGDAHISWLISDRLLGHFTRGLLGVSLVERLGLVVLLSVLSSRLIGVEVLLCGPGSAVPKSRVHRVARHIVIEGLTRTIQVRLILNVLVELSRSLGGEDSAGAAVSEDRRVLLLRVDVARSERRLIWRVSRVVLGVSGRLSARAISPRRRSQSIISRRDELRVEASRRHGLQGVVEL